MTCVPGLYILFINEERQTQLLGNPKIFLTPQRTNSELVARWNAIVNETLRCQSIYARQSLKTSHLVRPLYTVFADLLFKISGIDVTTQLFL